MHDGTRQNGVFKTQLAEAKQKFFVKKRDVGLPCEIRQEEVVIVLQEAINNSFNNVTYAKSALARRGWAPFNRATLDDSEILPSAPREIQEQRSEVLLCRGVNLSANPRFVPPLQRDLLNTGSGRLAGGQTAESAFVESVESLNYSGGTASDIMSLAINANNRARGIQETMGGDAAQGNVLSTEELLSRYSGAKRFTAGIVFGVGNGHLGEEVMNEVIRRRAATPNKARADEEDKKKRLRELKSVVKSIRKKKGKMTVKDMQALIKWKKQPGDKAIPTSRADCERRWNLVKGRRSPRCSPANSDAEEESESDEESEFSNESSDSSIDDDGGESV